MLGEHVLAQSLLSGQIQKPRPWSRPSRGLPATWNDEQKEAQEEVKRDPQANQREALSHSFRCSLHRESKGLSGNLVLVFARMHRKEAEPAPNPRSRELRWRQDNAELLDALAGQWLIVEGNELIAHGQDPASLVTAARRRGIQVPFIFFVEPRTRDTVKIGL